MKTMCFFLILLVAGVIGGSDIAVASDTTRSEGRQSQILAALRAEFQKHNPKIGHVELFDVRPLMLNPINYPEKPNHFLVVARGVRPDMTFKGSFEDELLGLFLFNDSLSAVEHTIALIPTQSWGDFVVKVTRVWKDSVTVQGVDLENGPTDFTRRYPVLK